MEQASSFYLQYDVVLYDEFHLMIYLEEFKSFYKYWMKKNGIRVIHQ